MRTVSYIFIPDLCTRWKHQRSICMWRPNRTFEVQDSLVKGLVDGRKAQSVPSSSINFALYIARALWFRNEFEKIEPPRNENLRLNLILLIRNWYFITSIHGLDRFSKPNKIFYIVYLSKIKLINFRKSYLNY